MCDLFGTHVLVSNSEAKSLDCPNCFRLLCFLSSDSGCNICCYFGSSNRSRTHWCRSILCFALFYYTSGARDICGLRFHLGVENSHKSTGIQISCTALLCITTDHLTRESLPFSRAVGDRVILIADRPNIVDYPRIEVISRKVGFPVNCSHDW